MKNEIEESAYEIARAGESGERVVVGLNRWQQDAAAPVELYTADPELGKRQRARLAKVRSKRDRAAVDAALKDLEEAAHGSDNLLYPMRDALASYATVGEVSDRLRGIFGEYRPERA
jgi:methylmalonyl-CoA mutase N-terminal domain/subunit